jgi:hypothetical protein
LRRRSSTSATQPRATVLGIDWFIWAAFALEYVIRLALTD